MPAAGLPDLLNFTSHSTVLTTAVAHSSRRGSQLRIRPLPFVAPVFLAVSVLLAGPGAAQAAGSVTESGTATYEVIPAKNLIQVTVQVSIHNGVPSQSSNAGTIAFSWNSTDIAIEQAAGPVVATSNGGDVWQSTISSDDRYRIVKLDFANVYFGQTRVVTAKYSIPSKPQSAGAFQATGAYASLCAVGNGRDSGLVSVVIPDGFDLRVDSGGKLTKTGDSGGKQVFSSGTQSNPKDFWTCVAARNAAAQAHTPLTVVGQDFDLQGWPGDSGWISMVRTNIGAELQTLSDLTGLSMPGGTIVIAEVGNGGLDDNGVRYDPATRIVNIPQSASPSTVAHALAHIWFNSSSLKDTWLSEGLALYGQRAAGEGNYPLCDKVPVYPGSGTPDLTVWHTLNPNSTIQDQNVYEWQYAAACAFFTSAAKEMGPDNFKNVLKAAAAGALPYAAATPGEKPAGVQLPVTSKQMLDLLEERGTLPDGVTQPDDIRQFLSGEGIFDAVTLAARSAARTDYHALATRAGEWKLPPAVRDPMNGWDFPSAEAAMAKVGAILDLRNQVGKILPGFSLDGTRIQTLFESASTQADLDSLASLLKKVSDASDKVARATQLRNGGHDFLQTIGLISADLDTPLKQAHAALQNIDLDGAASKADSVINRVNGSSELGLLWVIAAGAVLAFVLMLTALLIGFVLLPARRRKASSAASTSSGDHDDVDQQG
jgi:hypothetical protein